MKLFLPLLFLLFSGLGISQLEFNKTQHHFGKIYGDIPRYTDIYVTNKSDKPHYILSVRKPNDISVVLKSDYILPDSSTVLRLQVDKNTLGDFSYQIPVFTSDKKEPVSILLTGKIETVLEENELTACPDFNQMPNLGNPLDFLLTIKIVDEETEKAIPNARLIVLQQGMPLGKWNMEKKKQLKMKITPGDSYFYAAHPDYFPAETDKQVGFENNLVIIKLRKKPTTEQEELPSFIAETEEEIAEEMAEEIIDSVQKEVKQTEIIELINEESFAEQQQDSLSDSLKNFNTYDFSSGYFQPINVVFVLDVSSSMKQNGRLDLLKYSLHQLVAMLRPQDKIGLVTYATNSFVLLASTPGTEKEKIIQEIDQLKASGLTAGEAGIKLGYKQVKKNYLKNGKNHLIIVTDGSFNRNSDNYKKFIKRNLSKRNITMSIIAVRGNETALKNLREAAELGNGELILIENLSDAQNNLNTEIKRSTFQVRSTEGDNKK